LFHFVGSSSDCDEWISFGSCRIAPLHSKLPKTKKFVRNGSHSAKKVLDPKPISSFSVGGKTQHILNSFLTPCLAEARFDVFRDDKKRFFSAVVMETDTTCMPMKILFHFLKTSSKADEWVEYGSDRIRPYKSVAPLTTKEQKRQRLENQPKAIPATVIIDSMSKEATSRSSSAGPSLGPVDSGTSEHALISSCCSVDVPSCDRTLQSITPAVPTQPQHTGHASCLEQSLSHSAGSHQWPFPVTSSVKSITLPTSEVPTMQRNDNLFDPQMSEDDPQMSKHFEQPTTSVSNNTHSKIHLASSDADFQYIDHGFNPSNSQQPFPTPSFDNVTGYQSTETMVQQLSVAGNPNRTQCHTINNDGDVACQQETQHHQRPQKLSGLDVLAMLTEGLEVVAEQQPNLPPEQALHQYIRSQIQQLPR
jgi:hypothetical protein